MYRARVRRRLGAPRAPRPRRRWPRRSGRSPGRTRRRSFGRFADWLTELYRVEMPNFIDTDFDSALDLVRPLAGRPAPRPPRRVRPARPQGGLVLRRRAAAADLQVPVDVRRRGAVRGAGAVRRDHVHGLDRGRVRARRRDARHGDRPRRRASPRPAPTIRYDAPVTRILRGGDGAVTGVELAGGERLAADAVVCNADLPVAYRTLLGGVDAPRAARRGRYSPSCLLWVAGVRGAAAGGRRPPQHPLRPAVGRVVRGAHRRRRADARPVDPRHAALARRPVAGAARVLDALRPRAGAQPRRARRLDAPSASGPSTACGPRSPRPATRSTSSPRRSTTRSTGRRMGMERGTPFALAHTFRQTGPFRPAQRRPPRARPRVRRVVDGARRRRADGAGVGQAGRRPGSATHGAASR